MMDFKHLPVLLSAVSLVPGTMADMSSEHIQYFVQRMNNILYSLLYDIYGMSFLLSSILCLISMYHIPDNVLCGDLQISGFL